MANIDQKYFPALDGLRAICIAGVILFHYPRPADSALTSVPGWLGVDVFFVISGFLITTLSIREENSNGRVDLYSFYVRRFFRIIPLYLLILLIYVVKAAPDHAEWESMMHVLPYYLTFMNDVIISNAGAGVGYLATHRGHFLQTWSLGIEEKFYIVWPFVFFVLLRAKKHLRWLSIPVLFAITLFLPFQMYRSYFGLLLGCGLAVAVEGRLLPRMRSMFDRIPAVVICLLVAGGCLLVRMNVRYVFVFSVIGTLLVASIVLTDNWLARILSNRHLVWIGKRSYSMYLIQMFAIACVAKVIVPSSPLRADIGLLLAIGVSAGLAHALYLYVEEPSRLYGKRVLAKRGKTSSSITPSARAVPNTDA